MKSYKPTHRKISALHLAVLLANVYLANRDPDIGYEDADYALDTLATMLDTSVTVPISLIERALWSSNLLSVKEDFWHPQDISFAEYLGTLGITNFDSYYNTIESDA